MKHHIQCLLWFFAGAMLIALPACTTTSGERPTPQAAAFTTLKASAAAIDAYRADVERGRAAGTVSEAQWQEFVRAYNKANQAIIDAARLLRDVGGMDAESPGSVSRAVAALAEIAVRIVPPKP